MVRYLGKIKYLYHATGYYTANSIASQYLYRQDTTYIIN